MVDNTTQRDNENMAEIIINEMNYIIHECNKYVAEKEFDETRLLKFDELLAVIFIALTLKYVDKYNIHGLRNETFNQLKNFFKPFIVPDQFEEINAKLNRLIEKINTIERYLPPIEKKEDWNLYIQELLSGTADNKVREFWVGSYDRNLISVLLNHVELAVKFLKELTEKTSSSKN